jgi:hypothetical protein
VGGPFQRLLSNLQRTFRLIRDPRRLFAVVSDAPGIVARNVALFQDFLAGGVIVPKPPEGSMWPRGAAGAGPGDIRIAPADHGSIDLYSVIQLDGDLALKVSGRFGGLSEDVQQAALRDHVGEIRQRLAPMGELRDLAIAAATMLGTGFSATGIAGTIGSSLKEFDWSNFAWLLLGVLWAPLFSLVRWIVIHAAMWQLKRRLAF